MFSIFIANQFIYQILPLLYIPVSWETIPVLKRYAFLLAPVELTCATADLRVLRKTLHAAWIALINIENLAELKSPHLPCRQVTVTATRRLSDVIYRMSLLLERRDTEPDIRAKKKTLSRGRGQKRRTRLTWGSGTKRAFHYFRKQSIM